MTDVHHFEPSLTNDGRYRRLVDAVTDYAIFMLDPEGIVTSWNPGAERFHGYRASEIIGKHFSILYPPEDQKAGMPARVLQIVASEGRFETEGWRVRKGSTRFWAHVVIDPIRTQAGEIAGYAKITRDLTEKKRAEDALRPRGTTIPASGARAIRLFDLYAVHRWHGDKLESWGPNGSTAIFRKTSSAAHFSTFLHG